MDIDMTDQITIRNAEFSDLDVVIELDSVGAEDEKPAYWAEVFDRYMSGGKNKRIILVAESRDEVVGFIVGEVRAWEFGSPPCGWVFALGISSKVREIGIGHLLFKELCQQLKQAGVTSVRTMIDRGNKLVLSFFRSQGLRTGPYIELEKQLD
jgi:ribosomal protein S18 acetylase RimI-like enzyme